MTFLNIQIKYGKGQRKSVFQKFYDEILGYYIKLSEYEYWLDVMKNRNSCSKTDHDATFMATKWDYYNQFNRNSKILFNSPIFLFARKFSTWNTKNVTLLHRKRSYTARMIKKSFNCYSPFYVFIQVLKN
jgi:hypothetical protein